MASKAQQQLILCRAHSDKQSLWRGFKNDTPGFHIFILCLNYMSSNDLKRLKMVKTNKLEQLEFILREETQKKIFLFAFELHGMG